MTKKEIARLNKSTAELGKLSKIVETNQEKKETKRQRQARIRKVVRSVIEKERVAIAKRKSAFQLGAIGFGNVYFDIIVSAGKMPDYYAKDRRLRQRDCQTDAMILHKVFLSKLPDETRWVLLLLLKKRFDENKKLKLTVALQSKSWQEIEK